MALARLSSGSTPMRRPRILPVYDHAAIDGRPIVQEACGVVGVYGQAGEVANQTYFALFAVQHRGQESAGIAVADGVDVAEHADMGLVSHVFTDEALAALP